MYGKDISQKTLVSMLLVHKWGVAPNKDCCYNKNGCLCLFVGHRQYDNKAVAYMLNVDRIKLMTKLTSYEERAGKKALTITKYFKNDYVIMNMISVGISTTIGFFLLFGMWILYEFEYLMANIHKINLISLGVKAVAIYVLFLALFLAIGYFVYSDKYRKAKISVAEYVECLKELEKFYEEEERVKAGFTAPVGGILKYDDFTGV